MSQRVSDGTLTVDCPSLRMLRGCFHGVFLWRRDWLAAVWLCEQSARSVNRLSTLLLCAGFYGLFMVNKMQTNR
jgi:hypothetical protein